MPRLIGLNVQDKGGWGRSLSLSSPSVVGILEIVGSCAALIAWLIPNHYPPWTSFYNEAAMLVALAAFMVATIASGAVADIPRSAWAIVGIASIPGLQCLAGLLAYSGDALVAGAYLLSVAVAMHVSFASYEGGRARLALPMSCAALGAAALSALIAISQSFELGAIGPWTEYATPDMRAVANLAQPNNFATLLGLGALGAAHLYERAKLARVPAVAALVLLIIAGALTQSRISLLFGAIFMVAWTLLRRRGVPLKTPLWTVAILTLLHWVVMFFSPLLLNAIFGGAPETLASRGLETPRYQMWHMLLAAVQLAPWQGYGWLQVGSAELAVVDQYPPINELWLHGHNVFVELIVWCGWPLGLVLGATLIYWFVSRVWRILTLNAAFGMLAIAFIGLHALVELPHHFLYFLVPAALWAGIVEHEEGAATLGGGRWMLVPAGIAGIVFMGIAMEYSAIEDDFRLVRFESARIGKVHAAELAPNAPFLSSLTAFLRFARTEPVAGLSDDELHSMQNAVERYPYAASIVRYSSALALNGRTAEAATLFVKIRYLYGDRMYVRLRNDLHDKVISGDEGLSGLYRSLPDVRSLNP